MVELAAQAGVAANLGVFTGNYNRVAFNYDQNQRFARFCQGRTFRVKQVDMFRQDVEDLAAVAKSKLKTYGPIMTMSIGYCATVFVEGRSGIKFPAPATFISGLYLECLGIGFAFLTVAVWLVFHAALRAQIACLQLRTRKVRVPVPTQHQLDNARKLGSSIEEQNLYDVFKLPFVMPNVGEVSVHQGEAVDKGTTKKAKLAGKPKGGRKGAASDDEGGRYAFNQVPAFKAGNPNWIDTEIEGWDDIPGAGPSANLEAPDQPFEHFELVRKAQKEWWGAEAYNRICMLYGMIHFLQAFGYWLVIHCMTDIALVWAGVAGATTQLAAVWLIFRLDVLPDSGGSFPIEFGGPLLSCIVVMMQYTHTNTPAILIASKILAIVCIVMQILQLFRFYAIAMPSNSNGSNVAREQGGRLFNRSGACDAPSWLPSSFQVVTYLIAPPVSKEGLEKERQANDSMLQKETEDDGVDMMPWFYTKALIAACVIAWFVLLGGRMVELQMGERMLVTTPGAPPWTRRGNWYGWENGPITSKHYAHVTPMRGHFAWQPGWGPQGQQELWPSDLFGFHPEADVWWKEEGVEGAAGHGENEWAVHRTYYGTKARLHSRVPGEDLKEHIHPPGGLQNVAHMPSNKNGDNSEPASAPPSQPAAHEGGHEHHGGRRLRGDESKPIARPLVPAAVQWPALFEPDFLACGVWEELPTTDGPIAAITANGLGALVPPAAAAGRHAAFAGTFSLEGIAKSGSVRGLTWGSTGMHVATADGETARCRGSAPTAPVEGISTEALAGRWSCEILALPKFSPGQSPAVVYQGAAEASPFRAAVAMPGGVVFVSELVSNGLGHEWRGMGTLQVPGLAREVLSVSASENHLSVMAEDGAVYRWAILGDRLIPEPEDIPVAGASRTWRSACAFPKGRVVRLAATWRDGWQSELLL